LIGTLLGVSSRLFPEKVCESGAVQDLPSMWEAPSMVCAPLEQEEVKENAFPLFGSSFPLSTFLAASVLIQQAASRSLCV
jgi:hypothetical protein